MSNISYRDKNRLLILASAALIVLSYQLAFKETVASISRYHQLKMEAAAVSPMTSTITRGQLAAVRRIAKQYSVDSAAWKSDFWIKAASIAGEKGAEISFIPAEMRNGPGLSTLKQEVRFNGNFKALLFVVDSLEKSKELGVISALSLERKGDGLSTGTSPTIQATVICSAIKR